jgi:hypothetical protein
MTFRGLAIELMPTLGRNVALGESPKSDGLCCNPGISLLTVEEEADDPVLEESENELKYKISLSRTLN